MTSARALADTYAAYLAAQLMGHDRETIDFGRWLDDHWCDGPAADEDACFDAIDGVTVPGGTIAWVETPGRILGVLAGRYSGCYQVDCRETPPPVALLLDDAPECSTGSVLQERAHATAPVAALDRSRHRVIAQPAPWPRQAPWPPSPAQPLALVMGPDDGLGAAV